MKVKSESEVTQSCPTLSDTMDCSLPGSSAFPLAGLHFPAVKALRLLQVGFQVPGGWGGVAMEIAVF